jgi:hypothetical protein
MKLAAVFVLKECAGRDAARQIVRVGDRPASTQCALTQQKNAQYERYLRRASDLSHEVKKFAGHRRNSSSREPASECSDERGQRFLCFAVFAAFLRRTAFATLPSASIERSGNNAAKIGGRNSRLPAKRRAERTGIGEADIESDPRHGQFTLAQQLFGAFYPAQCQIAVRRQLEALLESPREMKWA